MHPQSMRGQGKAKEEHYPLHCRKCDLSILKQKIMKVKKQMPKNYLLAVGSNNILYNSGYSPMIYHRATRTSFILNPSSPFKFRSFFRKYKSVNCSYLKSLVHKPKMLQMLLNTTENTTSTHKMKHPVVP